MQYRLKFEFTNNQMPIMAIDYEQSHGIGCKKNEEEGNKSQKRCAQYV